MKQGRAAYWLIAKAIKGNKGVAPAALPIIYSSLWGSHRIKVHDILVVITYNMC
jgi:hypothetical protein